MTIALAVTLADGIVAAADSRTVLKDPGGFQRILTDYTQKLFSVGDVVVSTSGWNFICERTVAAHMQSFSKKVAHGAGPEKVACELAKFFNELYKSHVSKFPQQSVKGHERAILFLVSGFENGEPATYSVMIPGDLPQPTAEVSAPSDNDQAKVDLKPGDNAKGRNRPPMIPLKPQTAVAVQPTKLPAGVQCLRRQSDPSLGLGVNWFGAGETLSRLLLGYDSQFVADDDQDAFKKVQPQLQRAAPSFPWTHFTLQDGVDLALFCAETTIKMERFAFGVMGRQQEIVYVGGAIDVAVVTDVGFKWLKKKELRAEPQLIERL